MDIEPAAAIDFDDVEGVQDELVAMEEGDVPQGTAEAAAAGQAGDPLEMLYKSHPETILDYAEKVMPLLPLQQAPPEAPSRELGDDSAAAAAAVDSAHTSQPFLSVYERTKILGFRANQLAQGARPYVVVPEHVTRTLDIAAMELEQRRLPYIIKRPMPNGTFEYWRLSDLMIL